MNAIVRRWDNVGRTDEFRIVPLGDLHLGNIAADEHEKALRGVVAEIVESGAYTILMGDLCEYINRNDKRFDPESVSSWVSMRDLVDIGRAQYDYLLDVLDPLIVNDRILMVLEGNHETTIKQRTERDMIGSLVTYIKERTGRTEMLGPGPCGWLMLRYSDASVSGGTSTIKVYAHHGFSGGKLAGGKALNMQRMLWAYGADVILMGHDHGTAVQPEGVEELGRGGKVITANRLGCRTGNFLGRAAYAQRAGYLPMPIGYVDIAIKPRQAERAGRVRATAVML